MLRGCVCLYVCVCVCVADGNECVQLVTKLLAPFWPIERMDLRVHPCEFLRRFSSGVPRDIAVIKGNRREWNACNRERTRNRGLYFRLMATEWRNQQTLLAIQTAIMMCRVGRGSFTLPSDVVMRLVRFLVASHYEIRPPLLLTTWLVAPVRSYWSDYLFQSNALSAQGLAILVPCSSCLQLETNTLRCCAIYLQSWIHDTEIKGARVTDVALDIARRCLPCDMFVNLCRWTNESMTTSSRGSVEF